MVTYPTFRIALRNPNRVLSRYRPESERRTKRSEGITICESGQNGGSGRVDKGNGRNLIEAAYIVEK